MRLRAIALLAALLVLGCDRPSSDPVVRSPAEPVAEPPATAHFRQVSDPYPDASEVRLFVHTGYDDNGEPILASAEGRRLTHAQRNAFERALRIEPAPEFEDACFIPHHFFQYFDANGRKIGEVAVCFCCAGVSDDPRIEVSLAPGETLGADYAALEELVQAMGERTDVECD
jgi:hypothetical protein